MEIFEYVSSTDFTVCNISILEHGKAFSSALLLLVAYIKITVLFQFKYYFL